MIDFDKIIRGTNVTVYADDFYSDYSIGLSLQPELIYAQTEDEKEFELTDEEIEELSIEATDIYCCGMDY